jgi:hypothetical protein
MVEGVNVTMIYCENLCKCHMYPQHNNNNKKRILNIDKDQPGEYIV